MDLPIAIFIIYIVFIIIGQLRRRSGGGKQRERFDRIRGRNPQTGEEGGAAPGATSPPQRKQTAPVRRPAPMRGMAPGSRPAHVPGKPAAPVRGLQDRALRWIETIERQAAAQSADATKGQPLVFDAEDVRHAAAGPVAGQPAAAFRETSAHSAERAEEHGSLTLTGRQAPRHEGPLHEETVMHLYELDDCASPVEEFLEDGRKGELSLAEGMIWSQILGQPRCRQPALRRPAYKAPARRA